MPKNTKGEVCVCVCLCLCVDCIVKEITIYIYPHEEKSPGAELFRRVADEENRHV